MNRILFSTREHDASHYTVGKSCLLWVNISLEFSSEAWRLTWLRPRRRFTISSSGQSKKTTMSGSLPTWKFLVHIHWCIRIENRYEGVLIYINMKKNSGVMLLFLINDCTSTNWYKYSKRVHNSQASYSDLYNCDHLLIHKTY